MTLFFLNVLNKIRNSNYILKEKSCQLGNLIDFTRKLDKIRNISFLFRVNGCVSLSDSSGTLYFKIFTHQMKFFAIFLLTGVLKKTGLFIQPCPQSGVLR